MLESIGEEFPAEWLDRVERCGRIAEDMPKNRGSRFWDDLLRGLPEALLA